MYIPTWFRDPRSHGSTVFQVHTRVAEEGLPLQSPRPFHWFCSRRATNTSCICLHHMGFMKNKPSRNRAATVVTATNSPGTHPSRIPSFDADISSQDHPNYPTMGRCLHPLCKPDKIYRDLKRISHIGPSTRVFSCPGRALAETVLVGGTWKVTLGPGLLECSGGPVNFLPASFTLAFLPTNL